jgi:autotransporter-associated beta strand protein
MCSRPRKFAGEARKYFKQLTAVAVAAWLLGGSSASGQRILGLDVSYWQGEITQSGWNTAFSTGNRKFVMVRSSRGGTTGLDQDQGTPGGGTTSTLSHRYDDPRFFQNMIRANNAGLFTAPYHFARPDIAGNTGADEAEHFIQVAGAYMRPGYMLPMFDLEAGQANGGTSLAQFSLAFSDYIYAQKGIRPSIYINGNYSSILQGASNSANADPTLNFQRDRLAKPSTTGMPSVITPAFPVLVNARYPANSGNPYFGDIQNENPKDTSSLFYGPWDDYGNAQPWSIWQYSSGEAIPGLSDSTVDGDIAQGDIEFVKDMLIPAVWWNDSSGDWSTLLNWNSGQTVVAPFIPSDQATPYSPTTPLPVARLPGASGSGPTAGSNDTVILERPSANITVTVSTGSHNIRKMYMRETLNITNGTLTINYDPTYYLIADPDYATNPDYPNALHSGPISAQFSGPVTLSGSGNLSVHTLQVDATRTLTLAGSTGTLTFNTINLMPHSTTPAKILVTGNVNINPLNHSNIHHTLTATIANGSGTGSTGSIDLNGGVRTFNVGNVSADVDLDVAVPITNGGLTKNGAGTMRLSGNNTFAGNVTVNSGVLRYNHSSGLNSNSLVTVNTGGTLDMNNTSDTIAGLAGTGGAVTQGTASLTISATSGTNMYSGAITGTGALVKNGASTQILSGNNSLGPVTVNAGTMLFNGTSTTGAVTVANNATLGGTGSISGAVTINSGGHLAPGASIESLGVGALTLSAGSVLDFELASSGIGDRVNVTGLLTLNGGSINLFDTGTMSEGTYTLIDYGTLSGSIASLGTPTGPAGFNYELQDTGSLIYLIVSPPGVPGDFNEDLIVDAADYLVWRMNEGTTAPLPNDNGLGGTVGPAHFDLWRSQFGTDGSGSGSGVGAAVPEPATTALVIMGSLPLLFRRRRVETSRQVA